MKKILYVIATSFVMLYVFLNPLTVYCQEADTPLLPASLLRNYPGKAEIEALAEDILEMANCFDEEGFHGEAEDIQFPDAYCVYVNADILSNLPKTAEELKNLLSGSDMVWNIPVCSAEKTVIVQVSRALELDEVDHSNLTDEERNKIASQAGTWQVVSSTLYENGETPVETLINTLAVNHASTNSCVLIGGEKGIYSMMAVLLENNTVVGALSMERDISYSEPQVKTRGVNESLLEKNKVYSLQDFSNAAEKSYTEMTNIPDSTLGTSGGSTQNYYFIIFYLSLGILCLGLIISCRMRRKSK